MKLKFAQWIKRMRGSDQNQIEIVDRYVALGISRPDPATVCLGHCEGTGWVPVLADDPDPRFRELWQAADLEAPSNDGYHFVKCPDCNGTGKRK